MALFQKGIGRQINLNHLALFALIKISYPDIQYHFLPVAIRYDGKAPAEGHGFQLHVGPMRSKRAVMFIKIATLPPRLKSALITSAIKMICLNFAKRFA